jgi:ATP-dependent DNA ligase
MISIKDVMREAEIIKNLTTKKEKQTYITSPSLDPDIQQFLGAHINMVGVGPEIADEIKIGTTNTDLKDIITAFDVTSKISSSNEKRTVINGITLSQDEKNFVMQTLYSVGGNLGLGVTIPRISNNIGDIISPMLAANKEFYIDDCIIEEKYNGHRMLAHRVDDKIFLRTRNGKPMNSPKIAEALLDVLPNNTISDGEIISNDRNFENLHVKSNAVMYQMFDIMTVDGRDIKNKPLSYRRNVLEDMVPNEYVGVSEILDFNTFEEIDAWILKTNSEGIVAKEINSTYIPGKRSWYKRKPVRTLTAKIVGMTEGKGKRKGIMGAIQIIPTGLTETTKCGSGFTDSMLIDVAKRLNRGEQLYCTVEFQSITKAGRLQFPRFVNLVSGI